MAAVLRIRAGIWGTGSRGWSWRRPRYPWRWGYPWSYGYGLSSYPGWGWYGAVGYDYSYPAQVIPTMFMAIPMTRAYAQGSQIQQDEIDRLNQEVARLREEQTSREPPSAFQPRPNSQIHAETVLVFRDKHSEEIQNYAIVGKTLWVFTELRARKIPVASWTYPPPPRPMRTGA